MSTINIHAHVNLNITIIDNPIVLFQLLTVALK